MAWLSLAVRRLRRAVRDHRRGLAALAAAGAVLLTVDAAAPPRPPTVEVLVAARDVAAGVPLQLADLSRAALPPALVPDGALRPGAAVLGRLLAGPVRRGEPLTDLRLVGPGLLARVGGDAVAVPIRLADAGSALLLRPGDRVDVLASAVDASSAPPVARVVAAGALVVAVPPRGADDAGEGGLVVVAVPASGVGALAGAAAHARLSIALRSS